MGLRDDERGAAIQVGFVILLGFIVLAMAMYQATVVPSQNKKVEFNHNQLVQGQMQEVRNGIVSVPGDGSGRSVSVKLGTTYPARTVFVNPPPPSGQLRTTPASPLRIDGAVAAGETGDFWNGTAHAYSTRGLVYAPDYHVYGQAPTTVYENTVVYDRPPNTDRRLVESEQQLIDGRRITLVTLNGSYQEATTRTVSVDLDAVSTSTNVVTVRNDSSGPITITVPTRMSVSTWRELLADEIDDTPGAGPDDRYVVAVTDAPGDAVRIELESGVWYDLRMAKVGIGTGATDPSSAYLLPVEGGGTAIAENTTTELVVEVRDRFNNPLSNVDLAFSTARGDSSVTADPASTTDADGRVTLVYEAPADVDGTIAVGDRINVSFATDRTNVSGFDPSTAPNVSMQVVVENADGSGLGGDPGPGDGPPSLRSASVAGAPISDADTGTRTVTVEFNQSMNASDPFSVRVEGLSGGPYAVTGGSWDANNDTWTGSVTLPDTNEETTATVGVSGAEDPQGNLQTPDPDGRNFQVDTKNPGISSFSATNPSGRDIEVSMTSNESLADVRVEIRSGGSVVQTLDETDFSGCTSGCAATATVSSTGTYDVVLTRAEDAYGNPSPDTPIGRSVTISAAGPTASLSHSPSNPARNETVTFDASGSSGSIQTYYWDFDGDGVNDTTTTTATVTHEYLTEGSYTARVVVENGAGRTDSATTSVTVVQGPVISAFEPEPTGDDADYEFVRVYFPTETNTTGWVLRDEELAHTTALPSANLTGDVYFARNASAFASRWGIDPARVYEMDTRLNDDGERIRLKGPSGNVRDEAAYDTKTTSNGWSIPVGAAEVATRVSGTPRYQDTNTSSDWTTEGEGTFFDAVPPSASFTWESDGPSSLSEPGEPVHFDASGSSDPDGSIASYDWDFGDGTTATGVSPDHTYFSEGDYTVTLTVTDDDGNTNTTTQVVPINLHPSAAFDYTPGDPASGDAIEFNASDSVDSGDGTIVTYRWEFGDGTTATGEVVTHNYASAGTYRVNLTVVDDDGENDTVSKTVRVEPELVWETAADWDATTDEYLTVHEGFGDHRAAVVEMGYPSRDRWTATDPLAYYPLDEDAGSTAFDVTNGYDGTIEGTPAQGQAGILNTTSYYFDHGGAGTIDQVNLSTGVSGAIGDGPTTWTAWIRTTNTSSVAPTVVAAHTGGSRPDAVFDVNTRNGYLQVYTIEDGGTYFNTSRFVADGAWHHVAVTVDGSGTLQAYVDGAEVTTGDFPNATTTTVNASHVVRIANTKEWVCLWYHPVFGYCQDSTVFEFPFDGNLDEVRIYDQALSATEIANLADPHDGGNAAFDTAAKTATGEFDVSSLQLATNLTASSDGAVQAYVYSDPDGDGTFEERSDRLVVGDNATAPVTGLSQNSSRFYVDILLQGGPMDGPTIDWLKLTESG